MRAVSVIFIVVVVGWLASSCEQNIAVDLGDYEQQLVVHSIIRPGVKPRVYLTESRQYFDDRNIEDPYNFVHGATVTLSNGSNVEILQPKQGYVTKTELDGGFVEKDSLLLDFYEGTMDILPGGNYELNIKHNGREVSGFAQVPYPVEITETFFRLNYDTSFGGNVEKEYRIGAFVNDPADRRNYYQLEYSFSFMNYEFAYVDTLMPGDIVFDTIILSLDGNTYDTAYTIVTDSSLVTQRVVSKRFSSDDKNNGGRIRVRDNIPHNPDLDGTGIVIPFKIVVRSVTKELADYYDSLDDQKDTENNPFAEPVLIKSNVIGGLGLFGAFSKSQVDTVNAVFN